MKPNFLKPDHKPRRNKLNIMVIEIKRNKEARLPFFVLIGSRHFNFTLPGWTPWLLWMPILMCAVALLYFRQQALELVEPHLLRLLFAIAVMYVTICQRDCLLNLQTIVQAAYLAVHGLPRMPSAALA